MMGDVTRFAYSSLCSILDELEKMNDRYLSTRNTATGHIYYPQHRRRNRTNLAPSTHYLPSTTTIVTTNDTRVINSSFVPINDLLAPLSYLTKYKYVFFIGLSLLLLLCVISILFILILKCTRGKNYKNRRGIRLDKKHLNKIPDFLETHYENKGENSALLQLNGGMNSSTNHIPIINGIPFNDNISNTLSLDPMLEQKIYKNNPPNAKSLSPAGDDTSLDTLRGSLISSPSQQICTTQIPCTSTEQTTTTDSTINSEKRGDEAEEGDDLQDLDLKRIQPRFIKATSNSSSNLHAHRTSGSSLEQSIRRQERRAEEEERGRLHGSNSNLYEKELRRQAEQEKIVKKEHTNSQASLVSRTSEDSCY